MDNTIRIGDKVFVEYFEIYTSYSGIVKHIPGDVGDMWHIETEKAIIAVNPMCSILVGIYKDIA